MSNQFKVGDLALIVNARRLPEFIGTTVELCQRVLPGESYRRPGESLGNKNDSSAPSWVCLGEQFNFEDSSEYGGKGWAQVAEHHLMPLRGDFAPEQQKTQAVPA